MNFWDIALIIVNFSLLTWSMLLNKNSTRWIIATLILSIVTVFTHIGIEAYLWQMIPAYLSPVVLGAYYGLTRRKKQKGGWVIKAIKSFLIAIYLCITITLPLIMPMFNFEKPTGPYAVGTTVYHWVDSNREEWYTKKTKDKRELMVQFWYPAKDEGSKPLPSYVNHVDEIAEGLEKAFSIPAFTFKHLGLVKSHAYADATISNVENTYPVLVFSHGLTGFRNQNTFEVEELASHGYIVVGIDHAYDSAATVYPDGRTAYLKSPNLTENEWDDHIDLWMDDVDFVLNQIEKLNQEDEKGLFTNHLDTSHIGMFGHSYGGATATQMLAKDARIKAAINMDGTLYGNLVPKSGLEKPFLLMNAPEFEVDEDLHKDSLRNKHALANGGMSLTIPHTDHMSFTDFPLFSPLLREGDSDLKETHQIINEFSLAFFNRFIKEFDDDQALEKLAKKYSKVNFTIH